MATDGNMTPITRSVHWNDTFDVERGCPNHRCVLPGMRNNRGRYAAIQQRPTIVVHRDGVMRPATRLARVGPHRRIERMQYQPEPIDMCRCNLPLAITIAGIILFCGAGIVVIFLDYYGKI